MLFKERKRRQEIAQREAAGESFWTDDLDDEVRIKIIDAFDGSAERGDPLGQLWDITQTLVVRSLGSHHRVTSPRELLRVDQDVLFSYIEAHVMALGMMRRSPAQWTRPEDYYLEAFQGRVTETLNWHRVSFRLVDGQIIPLSSDELHVEVVEPTLRLLARTQGMEKAHGAYLDALREISAGHASDAITDAGTALQETLVALRLDGNALGPLINSAKKKGLLARHDQALGAGIEKFLDWVSADRSEKGDAHKSSDASLDDAWLMVHVVGALIVRLTGQPRV